MATHASVAASEVVRRFAPGLAALAGHIADAQVRNMGTIGGSLAHNDPAACWPAGVLAMGATVVTSVREIEADAYFQGLYTTALTAGELILGVRFPPTTGMQALSAQFDLAALENLAPASAQAEGLEALGDMHASAAYRCHLAHVLLRRCVAELSGSRLQPKAPLMPLTQPKVLPATSGTEPSTGQSAEAASAPAARDGFGGSQHLAAPAAQVWQAILDPVFLQHSIPGCEALVQRSALAYEATVKVGLGPLSVRFKSEVTLSDLHPPQSLTLGFVGQAGALGSGQGTAQVRLAPAADGSTVLHWWVQVQLSGRLAQFGNRLVEASARQLSEEFFRRFSALLQAPDGQMPSGAPRAIGAWQGLSGRLQTWFQRIFSFFRK
jgi:carbon monoxide dehydrogenase subunit G